MSDEIRETEERATGGRRLWILASALGAVGLVVVVLASWIAPSPAEAFRFASAHARGGFGGDHDRFDADHVRFGVAFVLEKVDASDEQIDQVVEIAVAAMTDLRGLHDQFEGHHEAWREALEGEQVDRARLEALRVEALAALDQASARMAQALADGADVLTAEQRAALIEHHEEHRGRRHGWH